MGRGDVGGGPARVHLGAFGKHPAWHDHIFPAIGVEGRLSQVMDSFYLGGIQDAVGYWRQLEEKEKGRLVRFGHSVAWQLGGGDVVVMRLWYSTDGASPRRDDYPMVVCAQCNGVPPAWALAHVPAVLARLEARCKEAQSKEEVTVAVGGARGELAALAAGADAAAWKRDEPGALAVSKLVDSADIGQLGVMRAMYALEGAGNGSVRQARVPRGGGSEAAALGA